MAAGAKRESYHHGDLRAGLVEAARRLVEEKGPDRFSMSDACRIAGVSTAAPYRHFADKNELLIAVAMEGMHRQRKMMSAAVAGLAAGSLEALTALGLAYIRFATSEPGVFRLMFGLTRTHGEQDELIALGRQTFGLLLAQVAAATGSPPDSEEVIARSFPLWTFAHGLSFLLIDEKTIALDIPVDLQKMVSEASARLLGGVPAGSDGKRSRPASSGSMR